MSALLDHDPWGFGSCIMASIFMGNATIIILSGMGTFECCVILLESHFCVRAGMLGNYVLWFGIASGKQILHFTRTFLSRVTEMQTLPVSGFGIPTILKCNCNLDFTWQATKKVACLGCDQVCRLCFDTWHFCS